MKMYRVDADLWECTSVTRDSKTRRQPPINRPLLQGLTQDFQLMRLAIENSNI